METGNLIRKYRLIRGYTLKHLADKAGVSEKQMGNIENGITRKISPERKK